MEQLQVAYKNLFNDASVQEVGIKFAGVALVEQYVLDNDWTQMVFAMELLVYVENHVPYTSDGTEAEIELYKRVCEMRRALGKVLIQFGEQ